MKENIKSIIDYAIYAPSGDNSQPWKFRIQEDGIKVYLIRDRDNPILNFNYSGTYIANGAVIENIRIAATHFGYDTNTVLLPDGDDPDLVAEIKLNKNHNISVDPLFKFIKERHTNRKKYKKIPLTSEQILQLSNLTEDTCRVAMIHDHRIIKEVANACSVTERVALETQALHKLFFESIVWSREQEKEKGGGLYHKTLELPKIVLLAFKLVKNWSLTKVLNKIGFSKKAAEGNAKTYASSAAMVVIVIDKPTSLNYLKAGILMQRLWLKATELGLSIQPVTGTLFLAQRVIMNELGQLLPEHKDLIRNAHEKIKIAFGINNSTLAMQFRIGYSNTATARSYRNPPQIID